MPTSFEAPACLWTLELLQGRDPRLHQARAGHCPEASPRGRPAAAAAISQAIRNHDETSSMKRAEFSDSPSAFPRCGWAEIDAQKIVFNGH